MEIPQPLKPSRAIALWQPLAFLTYPLQILRAWRGADPRFDRSPSYFIPHDQPQPRYDNEVASSHRLLQFRTLFLASPLLEEKAVGIYIIRLASDLD